MAKLAFWYEFASTYSYLSAMRIEELIKGGSIEIEWKPFLLGPIFQAQGWTDSPFNQLPGKGRYMERDLQRIAKERGLGFRLPARFPQNSLKAARLAVIAAQEGWVAEFTRRLFVLEFAEEADISDEAVLALAIEATGRNPENVLPQIQEQSIKDALREQTGQAATIGIFGAPSFVTEDGELFWGDDRLEQAIRWAMR